MSRQDNLIDPLAAARASLAASAMRGEWLQTVSEGLVSLPELFEQSTLPGFEPLKKIRLHEAVNAHLDSLTLGQVPAGTEPVEDEGWLGTPRQIIERVFEVNGINESYLRSTIGSATQIGRTTGTVHALVESLLASDSETRHTTPWPGYPLSAPPALENP